MKYTTEILDPYITNRHESLNYQTIFIKIAKQMIARDRMCAVDRIILVLIINGEAHLMVPRKTNNTGETNADVEIRYIILKEIIEKQTTYVKNDTYFFITLSDRPCWTLGTIPHLSVTATTQDAPHVLPMPLLSYFDCRMLTGVPCTFEDCKKLAETAKVDWDGKENIAFFCGNMHGRHTGNVRSVLSEQFKKSQNVKIRDCAVDGNAEPFFAWGRYKVLLSIAGNEPWTDRDLALFCLGSLVIRIPVVQVNREGCGEVTTTCLQWIDNFFKEGIHYLQTPPIIVTGTTDPRHVCMSSVQVVVEYLNQTMHHLRMKTLYKAQTIAFKAQRIARAIMMDRHCNVYYSNIIKAFSKRAPLFYDQGSKQYVTAAQLYEICVRNSWCRVRCPSYESVKLSKTMQVGRKRGCPGEDDQQPLHKAVCKKVFS